MGPPAQPQPQRRDGDGEKLLAGAAGALGAFAAESITTARPAAAAKIRVALTTTSLMLATLQHDLYGVYLRSAVPNVTRNSFTLHLSQPVLRSAKLAWFVVN